MSVVAKMYARSMPRRFHATQQVDLECVCDDRLFTINDPVPGRVKENQTFSEASPMGDCRFELPLQEPVGQNEEFYLVFVQQPDQPAFPAALVTSKVRCYAVTDFGGTSKQVDVSSAARGYSYMTRESEDAAHAKQTWSFTMRMTIDNPHAAIQFKPDGTTYWLAIYRAKDHDLHEALADALHPAAGETSPISVDEAEAIS